MPHIFTPRCVKNSSKIQHGGALECRKWLKKLEKRRLLSKSRRFLGGGDKRDRTADLLNAIQALSQLSYTPIFGSLFHTAFAL